MYLHLVQLIIIAAGVTSQKYALNCPKFREEISNRNFTFRLGGIKLFNAEGTLKKALVKKCIAIPEDGHVDEDNDVRHDYVVFHPEMIPTTRLYN